MPRRKLSREEAAEERASLLGLGLAVERLRRETDSTRDAVAKRGGLTSNTITHIEKGLKTEPRWETLRRLSKGLDVALDDLVRLSVELAPGMAGERLRRREEDAKGQADQRGRAA